MSAKEIQRLEVIQKLLSKEMKQIKASELLGVSIRQIQRLLKAYKTQGVSVFISKKRDKISNSPYALVVKASQK
jgi:Trp operon repressor